METRLMRTWIVLLLLVLGSILGCRGREERSRGAHLQKDTSASAPPGAAGDTSAAARRADSLDALYPEAEAAKAIARHDLRYLAVCGFACVPVGVEFLEDSLREQDIRPIAGTTDHITGPDVARLNESAGRYAERYNRVILRHRQN